MVNVISGADVNSVLGANQIFYSPQFYRCDPTLSYVDPSQLWLTGYGTDNTLNLLIDPTTTTTTLASTINNIQRVYVKDFKGTSGLTLDMKNIDDTGASAVWSVGVDNSDASVTFDKLKAPVKHILYKDVDGMGLNVIVDQNVFNLNGTPIVEVDINNVRGTGATLTIEPDLGGTTGYRSVILNSIGTKANTLEALNDGASVSMKTVLVRGNQPLTLTNAVVDDVTKIDASGMISGGFKMGAPGVGVINLYGSKYGDILEVSANNAFVLANSGDDLIIISSGGSNIYTVDGGNGQDKTKLTMSATTTTLGLENTEILEIVASGVGLILTNLNSFDNSLKTLTITGGQTVTIANPNVGIALTTIDARGMTAGGLVMSANPLPLPSSPMQIYGSKFAANTLKGGSADDTITIEANTGVNHDIDANEGTDTLNITLNGASNTLTVSNLENMNVTLAADNSLTITESGNSLTSLVVTGGAYSLNLGGALGSSVTKVDATGITGGSDALIMNSGGGSPSGMRIDGSAGDDQLRGGPGADNITGGPGADTIRGEAYPDRLTGNGGRDNFVVTVTSSADTVTDFVVGSSGDKIQFDISDLAAGLTLKSGGSGAITSAMAGTVQQITGQEAVTTTDKIFVISGATYGTSALLEAAIEFGGARQITLGTASSVGDDYIIVYSDGTDGHVGYYNAAAATSTFDSTGTYNELMTLSGIDGTEVGNLVTANFDFIA